MPDTRKHVKPGTRARPTCPEPPSPGAVLAPAGRLEHAEVHVPAWLRADENPLNGMAALALVGGGGGTSLLAIRHFVWPDADTGTAQHASGPMRADEGAGARGAAGTALSLAELSRSRIGWSQGPRARSASRPTPDAPRQRPYPIHRGGALPGKPDVCRRSSEAVSTLQVYHHPNRARRAHAIFPVPARPGVRDRRAVRACSWPGWPAWLPVPPSL